MRGRWSGGDVGGLGVPGWVRTSGWVPTWMSPRWTAFARWAPFLVYFFWGERVNRAVTAELQQGFKDQVRSLPPGVYNTMLVLIDSLYFIVVIAVGICISFYLGPLLTCFSFKVYIGGNPGAALS